MKCLVQFRFLPFPLPLGESIFDRNMNLSGCSVSEVLTTPCLPAGEQDTAIPSDLYSPWKVRGHSFSPLYIGGHSFFFKGTFPPACNEDLREASRREALALVKLQPADVMA